MSLFQKPSLGIAIGAGLAVVTVWSYQNLATEKSTTTRNRTPTVRPVRTLQTTSAFGIQLASAQDGATNDAFDMEYRPDGISLNSPVLKAEPSDSLLGSTATKLETLPTQEGSSSPENVDLYSAPKETTNVEPDASLDWPSEVLNIEPAAETPSADPADSVKQASPVVKNIRESWEPPVRKRTTNLEVRANSIGSSFSKNPHFAVAQNRQKPQSVEVLDPASSSSNLSQEKRRPSVPNNPSSELQLDSQAPNSSELTLKGMTEHNRDSSPKSDLSAFDANDGISVLVAQDSSSAAKDHSTNLDSYERILSSPIAFAQSPEAERSTESLQLSEAVAVRAVQHIEYGKTLARRGARASAKQEFMAALSIVAQDFDAQGNTNRHSQALRRGMKALKEAEEFVTNDSESQIGMDVSSLVESHQCGALTRHEAMGLSSLQALQRYFSWAQRQIEASAGKNIVSAEALYCLGRLHTLADSTASTEGKLDRARAMVYHRASLRSDATNYRSANELGVLLAEFGELRESVELLKESLVIRQTPSTWENLAKVHSRLNQPELAALATVEYQRAQSTQSSGMIRWLEQSQFNQSAPPEVIIASNPVTNSQPKEPSKEDHPRPENGTDPKSLPDRVKSWF